MDLFTLVSVIIIIASLTWSVGVLVYALIKKIIQKRKDKKLEKEVLSDDAENIK